MLFSILLITYMFMAGLNIIIMAASSWRSRLLERSELSEKVAAGETAEKASSKSSALTSLVSSVTDIPPPPANPGKKVTGGKRKDPSGPLTVPKRPRGSSSYPSQPSSRVLSLSSRKGKEIQGRPLLRLSGPPLSDQLGKPVLDLLGEECEAVFQSLSSKEVTDRLKKVDFPSLKNTVSENLMQVSLPAIILFVFSVRLFPILIVRLFPILMVIFLCVLQASLVSMEVFRRAEKAAAYREELRSRDETLKKMETEKRTWLKQMADLRSQMSQKEKEAEEKIQSLSRELKEKEQQGLLAGMEGCREQILFTPVGQQFLHVLKEELI